MTNPLRRVFQLAKKTSFLYNTVMFSNVVKPDPYYCEGTVVQVDAHSSLCAVRTLRGQVYTEVQWLSGPGGVGRSGDRACPEVGARVIISLVTGYPVIFGFLPRLQTDENTTPIDLFSGETVDNPGSVAPSGIVGGDKNKPKEFVAGDRVISSTGAALLALLRGGSVLLRASRVSEIFLSKISSLVRITGRNWEHFTDLSSDVIRNFKGTAYRYTGYSKNFLSAKVENYQLRFYYGNVATAEAIKTGYHLYDGAPTQDSILYKEQVANTTNAEYMHRTLSDTGEEEVVVTNGSVFTRINQKSGEIRISWNDQNTVVITEASIHAYHKDGADVILDSNGVRATMGDSNVNIDPNRVKATHGAGYMEVTDSSSKLVNGGHSVTVTSGGVAIA